ncbi:MAG: hypothetical protein AAB908_01520 [Patescibacteria group bacterium]
MFLVIDGRQSQGTQILAPFPCFYCSVYTFEMLAFLDFFMPPFLGILIPIIIIIVFVVIVLHGKKDGESTFKAILIGLFSALIFLALAGSAFWVCMKDSKPGDPTACTGLY